MYGLEQAGVHLQAGEEKPSVAVHQLGEMGVCVIAHRLRRQNSSGELETSRASLKGAAVNNGRLQRSGSEKGRAVGRRELGRVLRQKVNQRAKWR